MQQLNQMQNKLEYTKENGHRLKIYLSDSEEVFWLSGVYEPIMENILKNQF
jgi:hypothetical protein